MNYHSNIINVIYCCSDLFAEVCSVSMVSLFENNKALEAIDVYIIDDNMSDKSKKRIYEMSKEYGRNVNFIAMPDPSIFYQDERFTIKSLGHTYARMILGDVLPKYVERVISLDSDTMVLGSVEKLWNWKLDKCSIAGVDDYTYVCTFRAG